MRDKEKDLEKTKALSDLTDLRLMTEKETYEEYDNLFREKKYSRIQEDLDASSDLDGADIDENGDVVEDDTRDTTNDQEIETLLVDIPKKDKKDSKNEKEEEKKSEKKNNPFKNLIETFKGMSKGKKVLTIILLILILAAIGVGVYFIAFKKDKTNDTPVTTEEKDVIVIKDNYIYKNGSLKFLDEDDNEIGTYECTNKDENSCYVAYQGNSDDIFYAVKKLYEDETEIQTRIKIYYNRYVFVYDSATANGSIILYDIKTDAKLGEYELVKSYTVDDKDYVITKDDVDNYALYEVTEVGLQSRLGKEYKYLGIMEENTNKYIIAKQSNNYYILDLTGEELSKPISKPIVNYNEKYIVTSDNGSYSLYTYNNVLKLSDYRFINIENSYIVMVDKENKLYYKDNDLNKVNEEGFELNNDNYIPIKIYNKDGVLSEQIYSFQSNFTTDGITVAIKDDKMDTDYFKKISFEEYKYNKNIAYYSYMNGNLYFYSDEAKEKLLGTYTCDNKNEEFKDGELLNNCRPALDTVYEDNDMTYDSGRVSMPPIYNNKYVFIYDGTTNSLKVVLYDLSKNTEVKVLESVNTYTTANKGVLSTATVDSVNVIGKNKNGTFGMFSITKDNITQVYDFKYDHMELLNGKVLVLENNRWKLLFGKNAESVVFENKIRGYVGNISYYKTKDSSYNVYNSDGKKINNHGYDYVELYDDFYAAVDDKKLMIYDYTGKEIIEESVKLYSTTYYGKDSVAFMIVKNGNVFNIEVFKDGEYINETRNVKVIVSEPEPEPTPEPEADEE